MKMNRARLSVCTLEERATPAVSVIPYAGGRLNIRGDQTANNLLLSLTNNNTVQVFNNSLSLGTYLVNGDVTITMGNSNDTVTLNLNTKTLGGNVNIQTGNGGDTVLIQNGKMQGRLNLTGGNGADSVTIDNVVLGGIAHTLTANTGLDFLTIENASKINGTLVLNGFNTTKIGNSNIDAVQIVQLVVNNSQEGVPSSLTLEAATTVASTLTYTGGFGVDDVSLFGTINGNVTVNGQEGVNSLTFGDGTGGLIGGTLTFIGGASADAVTFNKNSLVAGSANLNMGNGDNKYTLNTQFTVAGALLINAGNGDDSVVLGDTVGGSVNGNINANLGNGQNTFTLQQNFAFNGSNLTYNGGSGVDNVTINNVSFAKFGINLFAGADTFTWGASAFAGGATIDFGVDFDLDTYTQLVPVVTWPQTLLNLP